jgi:hypothetical protein
MKLVREKAPVLFKRSNNTTKNFIQSAVVDILNPFSPFIICRVRLNGSYAVLTPNIFSCSVKVTMK